MYSPTKTLYYHSHITQNLTHVDQRTHKYIKHRKEFLKQYCSPLEQRISQLDKEIQYFKHLIMNQNEMIENEEEVARLKQEIGEFQDSQKYFLARIDEYQNQILELNVENEVIEQQIAKLKAGLSQLTLIKSQQVYNQLQSLNDNKSIISSGKHSRTMLKSSVASKTVGNSSRVIGKEDNYYGEMLPAIFRVEKYYGSKKELGKQRRVEEEGQQRQRKEKEAQQRQRTEKEGYKRQRKEKQEKIVNKQTNQMTQSRSSYQRKYLQLKHKFKHHTTSFNKFQLLFKQCFEKKKFQVQKSVTQLQSKLISDREKFLEICEAIGQRNVKRVGFHQFETLTGDELMTLFISFPWIQKKIFKELGHRRKLIVELQKARFL